MASVAGAGMLEVPVKRLRGARPIGAERYRFTTSPFVLLAVAAGMKEGPLGVVVGVTTSMTEVEVDFVNGGTMAVEENVEVAVTGV